MPTASCAGQRVSTVGLHEDAGKFLRREALHGDRDRVFADGQIVQRVRTLRIAARGAGKLRVVGDRSHIGAGDGTALGIYDRACDAAKGLLGESGGRRGCKDEGKCQTCEELRGFGKSI